MTKVDRVGLKTPPLGEEKRPFHKRGLKSPAYLSLSYCAILVRIYALERLGNG